MKRAKWTGRDVAAIGQRNALLKNISTPCAEIAIDPGKNVGLAARNPRAMDHSKWIILKTCSFWTAVREIQLIKKQYDIVCVYIEDARLINTTFRRHDDPAKQRRMAENVGQVKENSRIWEEFCIEYKLNYRLLNPADRRYSTKIKSAQFVQMTGTPMKLARSALEHGRDAGMILC